MNEEYPENKKTSRHELNIKHNKRIGFPFLTHRDGGKKLENIPFVFDENKMVAA